MPTLRNGKLVGAARSLLRSGSGLPGAASSSSSSPVIQVSEITTIRDLNYSSLGPGHIVAIDIDNTLVEPVQTIGSDQWFRKLWSEVVGNKSGEEFHVAKATVLVDYNKAMTLTEAKPVEEHTSAVISDLIETAKARGAVVIGLTSRGYEIAESTHRHVDVLGVKFHAGKNYGHDGEDTVAKHLDGIIFCNGAKKSAALHEYCERHKIDPHTIHFIDDHPKHVKDIGQYAAERGKHYNGWRYGQLDAKVRSLDWDVGRHQLDVMRREGRLISDGEALRALSALASATGTASHRAPAVRAADLGSSMPAPLAFPGSGYAGGAAGGGGSLAMLADVALGSKREATTDVDTLGADSGVVTRSMAKKAKLN